MKITRSAVFEQHTAARQGVWKNRLYTLCKGRTWSKSPKAKKKPVPHSRDILITENDRKENIKIGKMEARCCSSHSLSGTKDKLTLNSFTNRDCVEDKSAIWNCSRLMLSSLCCSYNNRKGKNSLVVDKHLFLLFISGSLTVSENASSLLAETSASHVMIVRFTLEPFPQGVPSQFPPGRDIRDIRVPRLLLEICSLTSTFSLYSLYIVYMITLVSPMY